MKTFRARACSRIQKRRTSAGNVRVGAVLFFIERNIVWEPAAQIPSAANNTRRRDTGLVIHLWSL